jgi:hypothetical protein
MSRFTTIPHTNHRACLPVIKASALAVWLHCWRNVPNAVQFTYEANGVSTVLIPALSYGLSWRARTVADLIGIANGGTASSVNEDDGDRNYKRKDCSPMYSKVLTILKSNV